MKLCVEKDNSNIFSTTAHMILERGGETRTTDIWGKLEKTIAEAVDE
jgi:hypothetical protein